MHACCRHLTGIRVTMSDRSEVNMADFDSSLETEEKCNSIQAGVCRFCDLLSWICCYRARRRCCDVTDRGLF